MHYRNIELFCILLLEFFYIDAKNVTKSPKFRKNVTYIWLQFYKKLDRNLKKKTQCYVVKQLFLFQMSPNSTM